MENHPTQTCDSCGRKYTDYHLCRKDGQTRIAPWMAHAPYPMKTTENGWTWSIPRKG